MTRIVLLRHGQTDHNTSGRFQGHVDVPLNSVGLAQARDAAQHLAAGVVRNPLRRIVSSDLQRAQQTAGELSELTSIPVEVDPRLREVDVGQWGGLLRTEVAERWPEEYAKWRAGRDMRMPGGESPSEVGSRGAAAVLEAVSSVSGAGSGAGSIVFVAHGAIILRTVAELLGMELGGPGRLGPLANCHWAVLSRDEHQTWVLHEWNGSAR